MLKQTINKMRFVENKDGSISITDTSLGQTQKFPHDVGMNTYKIFNAKYNADKVFEACLKDFNLKKEDIHLLEYNTPMYLKGMLYTRKYPSGESVPSVYLFQDYLKEKLREKQIDLSMTSTESAKYKITLSGNVDGISGDYVWMCRHEWVEVKKTKAELLEHIRKHPNIKIFEDINYKQRLIPKQKVKDMFLESRTSNVGIGSCESVHIQGIKVKMDKKGNLLFDHFYDVYD